MNPQTSFLANLGGRVVDDVIVDFGDYLAECDAFDRGVCLADAADFGLLRVSGVDAATFLHNQFSTNVMALAPGQGQHSTYNSPKGRMLASLFLWRDGNDTDAPVFFILLAADLVEAVRKRLSMYVLRAKVTLEDVSARYAFLGLCGAHDVQTLAPEKMGLDASPKLYHTQKPNGAILAALSLNRLLLIQPLETLLEHWREFSQHFPWVGRHLWRRAAILDGIPLITAATADRLIPQAANWDALGGLDFKKGCYPGQEIIARARYLGRVKERMYLARCEDTAVFAAGTLLYSPTFGEQSCGVIVNAAPDREGQIMLASFQTAAADDSIHVASPDGATLILLPLPYELPVDEAPNRVKL
ncbi:MAG: folate-binding protein [Betaproteobacteria bacterium]|nr:folate-binding protein [Betaproteobacteria bacterium]